MHALVFVNINIGQGYTCHIAVGIPKTAIGVTAILPTAISVTAMAAKDYAFFKFFGPFFMTISVSKEIF